MKASLFHNKHHRILMNLTCTLTFEKYFTASKNDVMEEDQPGTWLCKLSADCNSKSKTTGNRNSVNENSTMS